MLLVRCCRWFFDIYSHDAVNILFWNAYNWWLYFGPKSKGGPNKQKISTLHCPRLIFIDVKYTTTEIEGGRRKKKQIFTVKHQHPVAIPFFPLIRLVQKKSHQSSGRWIKRRWAKQLSMCAYKPQTILKWRKKICHYMLMTMESAFIWDDAYAIERAINS